jgi:hypothetical protein
MKLTSILTRSVHGLASFLKGCEYSQLVAAVYETRRFITAFTRPHHWSLLLWSRWIQATTSFHISLTSILMNIILQPTLRSWLWTLHFTLFKQNSMFTPSQLSATYYFIHSQLPSIYGTLSLHPQTWAPFMPWWHGDHLAYYHIMWKENKWG